MSVSAALSDAIDATGTLSDRVYRHLAERLVQGRLAPGDKLSLRTEATSLGVSMMPVREAVTRLGAEGALEVSPKRAVTVPLMRAAEFRDLTQVRIEIEGFAAARAALSQDRAAIKDIEACEHRFRALRSRQSPDLAVAVAANQAFHFAVYRAAGSPQLLAIIERLWLRAGPIINLDLRENPERLKLGEAVRFHADALNAIRAGDAEAARAAIANDISGASTFILSRGRLPELARY